jgi:hypothetical protein
MAPGFIQPVTEISTGRFFRVKRAAWKADNLTAIYEQFL